MAFPQTFKYPNGVLAALFLLTVLSILLSLKLDWSEVEPEISISVSEISSNLEGETHDIHACILSLLLVQVCKYFYSIVH